LHMRPLGNISARLQYRWPLLRSARLSLVGCKPETSRLSVLLAVSVFAYPGFGEAQSTSDMVTRVYDGGSLDIRTETNINSYRKAGLSYATDWLNRR
jgi:hypothetical protein